MAAQQPSLSEVAGRLARRMEQLILVPDDSQYEDQIKSFEAVAESFDIELEQLHAQKQQLIGREAAVVRREERQDEVSRSGAAGVSGANLGSVASHIAKKVGEEIATKFTGMFRAAGQVSGETPEDAGDTALRQARERQAHAEDQATKLAAQLADVTKERDDLATAQQRAAAVPLAGTGSEQDGSLGQRLAAVEGALVAMQLQSRTSTGSSATLDGDRSGAGSSSSSCGTSPPRKRRRIDVGAPVVATPPMLPELWHRGVSVVASNLHGWRSTTNLACDITIDEVIGSLAWAAYDQNRADMVTDFCTSAPQGEEYCFVAVATGDGYRDEDSKIEEGPCRVHRSHSCRTVAKRQLSGESILVFSEFGG